MHIFFAQNLKCTTCRPNNKTKFTRRSQCCHFIKINQCWKNLGILWSSRFLDKIITSSMIYVCLLVCVLQQGRHYQTQSKKKIEDHNNNFPIWLRVWLFGEWAETGSGFLLILHKNLVKNYSVHKLELLRPQNRYICFDLLKHGDTPHNISKQTNSTFNITDRYHQ